MECVKRGSVWDVEHRFRGADGNILARGVPVRNERGEITHWAGINLDISRLKRVEQSLRESEEELQRAQAVARTGSWRLGLVRNELRWFDENHRIFGVPKGVPLTYESFLSVVHPEDREFVDSAWKAMNGAPYDIEHRLVVDGEIRWVKGGSSWSLTPAASRSPAWAAPRTSPTASGPRPPWRRANPVSGW